MRTRLFVNRNGIVCLEAREPRSVTTSIAHDVWFTLEYKANTGWYSFAPYTDAGTAALALREASKQFQWRLVANHTQYGRVVMPRGWKPYRG